LSNGADVAALQRLVDRLRRRIAFIEGSRFWQLRGLWLRARALVGAVPSPNESQPISDREFVEVMDAGDPYLRWLFEHEPRESDLARMREFAKLLPGAPSIAIVVDDRTPDAAAALAGARAQVYPATTLIRTSEYSSDAGEWARFNAALAASDADVIAFCGAGLVLAPHAAFEIALGFFSRPDLDAAYGDWDVLESSGARRDPSFGPDWSPETFLASMYTGPLIFYRREAVVRAGGFRAGYGAALHYDLALRVFEATDRIAHRPSILMHELRPQGGAAPRSGDGADLAVISALERRGERGWISPAGCPGVRIVRYEPVAQRVEVIVATRDLAAMLERCLRSVFERNAGPDIRVTVVDNGSIEPETAALLGGYAAREPGRFRTLRLDRPFNFSSLMNEAVRATDAPYLLFLNNDAEFIVDGAIAAMLEYAARPAIGAVGARLLYPDGSLQHAGVVVGIGGYAGHVYRGCQPARAQSIAAVAGPRNYSAVTAACMMVRREAFIAAGGYDEGLAIEFNDVDLCLKLAAAGLRNVYLPHVVLRHDESSSRGPTIPSSAAAMRDRERFSLRWGSNGYRDPCYNANLTLVSEDAAIAG
jgi:GT2 family glycosyltransferase